MMANYQELLDDAFPATADANVIRGVSEGVMLADKTLESEAFLKSLVGRDSRGLLRRAGILFRLDQMAAAGDLPFTSTMSQMPRGNWHWIELRSKDFKAHVCRTDAAELFPSDTPTRQDDRLTNQGDLFADTSVIVPIRGYVSWLTFGVGDSGLLSHLCWGMPNSSEDVWLARTNIIHRAAKSDFIIKKESPPASLDLKFKEHVEMALKDKGPA
jgi:hypothetical protein